MRHSFYPILLNIFRWFKHQTPNKLNMIHGKTNRDCMVASRRTKGICSIESLLNMGCRNGSAAPKGNVVGFWSTKRDSIQKKKKKTWFHLLFQSAPKGVDYYYYFISHMRAHTPPLLLYIDKDMHKWCKWVEPSFVSARCKKAEPLTSRAWFICWTSWALALED